MSCKSFNNAAVVHVLQEAQAQRMTQMDQTVGALSAAVMRLQQGQDAMAQDVSQMTAMLSATLEAIINASGGRVEEGEDQRRERPEAE